MYLDTTREHHKQTPQESTMSKTSQSTNRRKRDPEATRTAILDAAEVLFLEFGPAGTPTSRIARRAGVTKSLIHHHFGSKEELWNEIKRRHFGQYYDVQVQLMANSTGTAGLLRESIVAYFRFLQSDPRSVSFMSWRYVESDNTCLAQEDELFEIGIERIAEAQKAGELRCDIEPISMIKAFLAMTLQWFQTRDLFCQMFGPDIDLGEAEEKYLQDILRIFFEGVNAPTSDGNTKPTPENQPTNAD
jgi:TetR/AcrR family transcriptional regulator